MESQTTIGRKFNRLWPYYILQSLLAASALFVIVAILGRDKMVAISAMGATTMIVFAMPKSVSARTRNVIGGHLVGLASGSLLCLVQLPYFVSYPLVVGMTVFLMVALDVEHAPAAGMALAVVINEVSLDVFVAIMVSILILSQCRYYLRRHLRDLV